MRTTLLVRYGKTKRGVRVKIADIYTLEEHGITRDKIDPDALRITDRLNQEGYEAYIVGGAVRDLLIGKKPKDFDIATDALPRRVRKIFWHSRIIGKRFRLVHVSFGSKIIEVSTFRSGKMGEDNNIYGTLEEDVKRRDFTCNALYYSPKEQYILDYVGGVKDIRMGTLKPLIPLDEIFTEDPVRMIRAIKYAVFSGFSFPFLLKRRMRQDRELLKNSSSSRLTEELIKILQSGYSKDTFCALIKQDILIYLLPQINRILRDKNGGGYREALYTALDMLDAWAKDPDRELSRGRMFCFLFSPFLSLDVTENPLDQLLKDSFKEAKALLAPLTPPNADVEEGIRLLCKARGIRLPRMAGKYQRRRIPQKQGPKKAG